MPKYIKLSSFIMIDLMIKLFQAIDYMQQRIDIHLDILSRLDLVSR